MIHYEHAYKNLRPCKASDLIIGNDCGLVCANCGACKCQDDKRPIEELDTLEQLEQRKLLAWHESNQFHKNNHVTGYSYPAHQLIAIEKRKLELQNKQKYTLIEDRRWDETDPKVITHFTGTENECFEWIHNHTSFSFTEATTNQGFKLLPLTKEV